jgi:hypothetical protein
MDEHMLKHQPEPFSVIPFALAGTHERPYCSQGFDLPVGSFMRTPYQAHIQYHTLLDNKCIMDFAALERTVALYLKVVKGWERNAYYVNTVQFCEPSLRKRGLYNTLGRLKNRALELTLTLHLLTNADGHHDLLDMAKRFGCNFREFEDNLNLYRRWAFGRAQEIMR